MMTYSHCRTIHLRIELQIRVLNGLGHCFGQRGIKHIHNQCLVVLDRHLSQLGERLTASIRLHVNLGQQIRRGPPGIDVAEIFLKAVQRKGDLPQIT